MGKGRGTVCFTTLFLQVLHALHGLVHVFRLRTTPVTCREDQREAAGFPGQVGRLVRFFLAPASLKTLRRQEKYTFLPFRSRLILCAFASLRE